MNTAARKAFAVWITGLPASGKTTVARAVKTQLSARGIDAAVLESDELRSVFTPNAHYDERERAAFYRQITWVGTLLAQHGVPVIFDATASLRVFRENARRAIPRFLEVFVDAPLEVCIERDPKGIYAQGRRGDAASVPGLQAPYEPPEAPEVVIAGATETPEAAAGRVVRELIARGYIASE